MEKGNKKSYFNLASKTFLSGLCRALSEKDYQLVGRVRIGGMESIPVENHKVPVIIGPRDLYHIHQKVLG